MCASAAFGLSSALRRTGKKPHCYRWLGASALAPRSRFEEEKIGAMRVIGVVVGAAMAALMSWPALAAEEDAAEAPPPQDQLLSEAELDQLVAPIALYPDALLAQVLMASTYPLEVVQADRFAKANASLKARTRFTS